MKDGLCFVDCDMHVIEPEDLFARYLDPTFHDRVTLPLGADGKPKRGMIVIDGKPNFIDWEVQKYRKRTTGFDKQASISQPLSGSRSAESGRLNFAIERNYDAVAQVMGMELEGVDIAVLFPTTGLNIIAVEDMDPHMSVALCQAYNNWIHEFCQHSPDQLKFAAMLPLHDVNLACRELIRCVTELGAVGSMIRPNLIKGHDWHSNYWNDLYALHEEFDVTWGFHEGMECPPRSGPGLLRELAHFDPRKEDKMSRRRYTPEQIISMLREAEVALSQGQSVGQACRTLGVSEQSYYRWRKEYGGLRTDQAKRLKELEKENGRLRKAVSDLTLDKLILKEALEGNY